MRTVATIATLLASLVAANAHAFTSAPGHADIQAKAKTKTVNGVKCVVGCTVKFAVRKAGGGVYNNATHVRPSVLRPEVAARLANSSDESRWAVWDPARSQAVEIFADHPVPDPNVVVPHEIYIDYAKHGLTSGQKLTLVTAWKYGEGAPHVYGTVMQTGPENEFVLP